jgi:NAD(P)-dependent dehydrogenase (short-subunit alcohol dehydrogenase family)
MKEFKDKVAVITGAASGIGRGMAESFAAAGMKIVLSDIEQPALEKTTALLTAAGADILAVVTDVSKADDIDRLAERALDRYGAVHVLCNNAGVGVGAGTMSWTCTLNDWGWILGVNLMGVIHGIRTFLPIMIKQDTEAHIVNTASFGGLVASTTLYSTTKFAVVGLSEGVYSELRRARLKPKISVLCPGHVDTHIVESQRNRPAELQNDSTVVASPAVAVFREWFAEQVKQGLNPRTVGDAVLAAIRDERFYILTHPEWMPFIEQRMKDVLSGNNPTLLPVPGIDSLMRKMEALRASSQNS